MKQAKNARAIQEMKAQKPAKDMIIRSYKPGDEAQIVDLLNLCYGEWGTLQRWQFLYLQYPTFDEDNVFVMENGKKEIFGHGGLHLRDLVIQPKLKLRTASLSDAAIHPRCRGKGLYSKLVETRLRAAKSKGACLLFSWHLKGGRAHRHNKKIGFIEIKQPPAYTKVLRPEKVLRTGLLDFLYKNPKLMNKLQNVGCDIHFRFGKSEFSISEILNKRDKKPVQDQEKIMITFDESSIYFLARFRNMRGRQRLKQLILLFLLRKAKARFSSFRTFLVFARKGAEIIGSI